MAQTDRIPPLENPAPGKVHYTATPTKVTRERPSAIILPTYSEILDLCLVKGWVEFERDKNGQRTDHVSPIAHAAIAGFIHALKQKPLSQAVLMGAGKSTHGQHSNSSNVIVRKFVEGASGLPDKNTGKPKAPKKEVRTVNLSEF